MPDRDGFTIVTDQPGMTQVVTREYLQIWGSDIMINRRFFKAYTLFLMFVGVSGYVAVKFLRVDSLVWSLYLANFWIVTLPLATILVGVGLILRWSHRRERKKREMLKRVRQELQRRGGEY